MNRMVFVAAIALQFISISCFADVTTSKFVEAAISLENPKVEYDSRYRRLNYPMGDVPPEIGVCSDVVIRAYRIVGIDLQQLVHQDMKTNFALYPNHWGLKTTDRNIDHRRVPNLQIFFKRFGQTLQISNNPSAYKPGDIVTWNMNPKGFLPHIGIVTNQYAANKKRPLIMHNSGSGQIIEDMLFSYKITGHYKYELSD